MLTIHAKAEGVRVQDISRIKEQLIIPRYITPSLSVSKNIPDKGTVLQQSVLNVDLIFLLTKRKQLQYG